MELLLTSRYVKKKKNPSSLEGYVLLVRVVLFN